MHRAQPDRDPARSCKRVADFLQGQVGLPGNQLQHPRAVFAQPAATVAAHRARARMALGPPALRPASSAANADIKPCRRCPCAAAQRHETNHTLPQILRVRGRHIASNGIVQSQPCQHRNATSAPWAVLFDTTAVPDGQYDLREVISDAAVPPNVTTINLPGPQLIDNTPPESSAIVTAPAAGAFVGGTVTLAGNAADSASGVGQVVFKINGTIVGTTSGSPASLDWDSTSIPDGPGDRDPRGRGRRRKRADRLGGTDVRRRQQSSGGDARHTGRRFERYRRALDDDLF